jgi:tRNA-modifying protein YgfZ
MNTELITEYEALTNAAGIAELPGRTIIAVIGSDRTQFLQSFTTNDIKKLSPGRGCEAFVTSPQGKTLGHVFVFCEADRYVLDTSPEQAAALISHFDRYVISEDVQFIDLTAKQTDLLIAGPKAGGLLQSLTGEKPPTEPLAQSSAQIAGHPVIVYRVPFAGTTSYFIRAAADGTPAVLDATRAAGAVQLQHDVVESGRLEAGFPLFGSDITPDNLPQEVARDDRAISFTKGCYLGQETVARIDAVGHVNRLLIGLKFSPHQPGASARDFGVPAAGTELLAGDQSVGHVTSAAWSPRLGAALAVAYVRRTHAKPGTQLSSAAGTAEVIKLPLTPEP